MRRKKIVSSLFFDALLILLYKIDDDVQIENTYAEWL
jgi:hypothetical protein